MSSVDLIKQLCKEKKIPVSRIEKDLGFANGYIGQKKKEFPIDRLEKIADYLGVSVSYLTGHSIDLSQAREAFRKVKEDAAQKEGLETYYYLSDETSETAQEAKDQYRVLFDAVRNVKPEDIDQVLAIIKTFTEE